jgi:hypothetical protein
LGKLLFLRLVRNLDGNEVRFGVEVVLARFIHDPKVSLLGGFLVRDDLVHLPFFKVFTVILFYP